VVWKNFDWSRSVSVGQLASESERAAARGLTAVVFYGMAQQVIDWLSPQLDAASAELEDLERELATTDQAWRQAKERVETLLRRYQDAQRMGQRDERRNAEHDSKNAERELSELAERAETLSGRVRERRRWVALVRSQLAQLRGVALPGPDVLPGLTDFLDSAKG